MFEFDLILEQVHREEQAQDAIYEQADRNRELVASGKFDGLIGTEPNPELMLSQAYWSGWCLGAKLHYSKKFGVELDSEF